MSIKRRILEGLKAVMSAASVAEVKYAAEKVDQVIDELAAKKRLALCTVCQKEEIFPKGDSDKCLICAMNYRDEMYKQLIVLLSPEQLAAFERYDKAESDVSSMFILG